MSLKDNYLQNSEFKHVLFAHFNYDKRKKEQEFQDLINEISELIDNTRNSSEFEKVTIFRNRYTAHMIPNPRDLRKFDGNSDVHILQSNELRLLIDTLATAIDKIKYLEERSMIDFKSIAKMAREESLALWEQIGDV